MIPNVRIFVISHWRRIRIREIMQLRQTLINVKLKRSQYEYSRRD